MIWIAAGICLVVLIIAAGRWRRAWIHPWSELEKIVGEIKHVRAPRTFLIDGNARAKRIGVALEEMLLRQRELTARAAEGELNVRTILGAMQDGLAVVDSDGSVQLLNSAAQRVFGLRESHDGGGVLETFGDAVVAKIIDHTLSTGAVGSDSIKLRNLSAAEDRHIAVTSLPMQRDDGERSGAVVLFHDVTQVQQLEKMRRDFVSNVSHELRTPLSIFRGYLETLLDEPELPGDERDRILRVLEKHSARLNSLVDDLLSLARLEAPDPHLHVGSVSLSEFVMRVAKEWEKKAGAKQLRMVVDVADDLPSVSADEARLEEIAYNLLDNAVNYSGAGTKITIAVRQQHDGNVVIAVTDEGTGIAAADLPRIFERFYRADKARSREVGGTGLGLSIVKHIAQLHGGTVEAESQVGRGTTVRVILPVERQTATVD